MLREYLGKGNFGKDTRLCSMDAPISEVWKAYESINAAETNTLRWLLDTYNGSDANKGNASSTQRQHEMYRNSLSERPMKEGTFGEQFLSDINPRIIRRYLDTSEKKVGANRHIQYLKAAWNWGRQRFEQVPEQKPLRKSNP